MLTLSKVSEGFHDQSKVKKAKEQQVEFVEPREDAAKTFQSAEQPLDFIAPGIQGSVAVPRLSRLCRGGTTGMKAQSRANCRVVLSSQARSMMRCSGAGRGPMPPNSSRPSTASEARPGERAKVMAVRAFAATL